MKPTPQPARWIVFLLEHLASPESLEEVQGDLIELHATWVVKYGGLLAAWKYFCTVLTLLRPLRKARILLSAASILNLKMLHHYFNVVFRNISRRKAFSIVNIAGLSLGLTCCLLIFLYVKDELSYDRFHTNIDQFYQLTCHRIEGDGTEEKFALAAMVQGPAFKSEIPEIQTFVRTKKDQLVVKNNNDLFREDVLWADDNFFSVFSFPLASGNPENSLSDMHSIVLTEEIALKYFGTTDVLGKPMTLQVDGDFTTFMVSAVAKGSPQNSTIKFKVLLPFSFLEETRPDNGWHWVSFPTYFVLAPQADPQAVAAKMKDVYQTQARAEIDEMVTMGYANTTVWGLQPFSEMHLNTEFRGTPEGSNPIYSYILSGIALFILLIACINFINFSIAQSLRRSKEIGIRKVIGGQRNELALQFLSESFSLCFIAFLIAMVMTELALPTFNELSDKELSLRYLLDSRLVIGAIVLFFATGFGAGIYPALVLSGFNPVKALTNRLQFSGKNYLSRNLVVAQFSLATFLIIATLFIYAQFDFITRKDLGYNDRHLVEIINSRAAMDMTLTRTLKTELARLQGVENVAPKNIGRFQGPTQVEGKEFQATYERVDEDYVPTMQLEVLMGRNFSKDFPSDSVDAVLVNQAFVREAGWKDPIGKTVDRMNIPGWGNKKVTVVGVVKDYHFESLKEKIKPELFTYEPKLPLGKFLIRIGADHVQKTLTSVEAVFLKMFPYDSYQYTFRDEMNRRHYQAENRWKQIITIGAVLAIFISCIGLFGLTALTAERRTKEIGLRKVMGASATQIVGLISGDFIKLVAISFIVAVPVVWYSIFLWLQTFAYRIDINPWFFAFAGGVTLLIAFLTIATQAVRAALSNPVKSLKSE